MMLLLPAIACKQSYVPPVITRPPNYLVVEGWIESNGSDSTFFTLSRTVRLDSNVYTPETGATVVLEDSAQNTYPLQQIQPGKYSYPPFTFKPGTGYRLRITTGGKEYASAYVPLTNNPPIDSISWKRSDDPLHLGLTLYASTHDPKNNTRYYRWSCDETWQYHVKFFATWTYINNAPAPFIDTFYTCWRSDNSANLALATSAQLAQDVIYQAPIQMIPLNSQKLQIKYTVLVRQYALTKEAFNWWQILQKNTESIGSIFGVQPSANPGNIRCLTDTSQQVLGFVGGGNTQTQRIFITNDQVKPWTYVDDCFDTVINAGKMQQFLNSGFLLFRVEAPGAFRISHNYCVDCTLTGINKPPSFWQ